MCARIMLKRRASNQALPGLGTLVVDVQELPRVVKRMTTTNLAATAQSLGAAAGGGSQRDRAAFRSEKASNGASATPAAVRVRARF